MKIKRRMIQVVAVLLLLAGAGFLVYPLVTQWIYNQQVEKIVTSFEADVLAELNQQNSPLEQLYAQLQQQNKTLFDEGQKNLKDPFSYQQPGINLEEYGISDNIIGVLSIPKINELLPIYLGANEDNMTKGAVHLTQTSYPIGGENTNSVIAAHRGYYKAAMFRQIQKLEIGDPVYVRNFYEVLEYKITDITIIYPDEIDKVLIQPGKDMLTLFTCHPYGQNTQRYVVYCQRV
ncbi:class C sortase [Ruminococcaceae bacterium OttesenSCG-928-A16]|nr:class C sortase [Ruminococcaceae bacterium OttesenSCG-928-A16]